jgi:hypothetical protein
MFCNVTMKIALGRVGYDPTNGLSTYMNLSFRFRTDHTRIRKCRNALESLKALRLFGISYLR